MSKRFITPATRGLLRHIEWGCETDEHGNVDLVATLTHVGGVSVILPIHGRMDYDDWLVLTDRITRFFFTIHGEHLFFAQRKKQ